QQHDRVTRSQAANTIVWNGSGWAGDNTDVLALSQMLPWGEGKTALILGSGGVARASWVALTDRGYHVTIMARHPERVWPGPTTIPWDWGALAWNFDVIVNATPLGQRGEESFDTSALPLLSQPITVVDWVYNPRMTPLLKWGQINADAQLIDGLSLLISQAKWAWMVWFGHMAPERVFEEAVKWSPL
ncbi:MAG: shikimate dehydrogenase, partial [Firmicutes bacterium]|nr:shikimate dehydrogenase [Bacillota bacterium]